MSFYAYTDKALKYLRRYYVTEFNRAKMQIGADRLNVISVTTALYAKIAKETERVFGLIAKRKYREIAGEDFIVGMWLTGFLGESNPLTGYIWSNDIDRKRQYLTESLLSGEPINKAVKKALRYWYGAQKEYADLVTDAAAAKALKDIGVKRVQWITNIDGRECGLCFSRHMKIYPIDSVPKKPHYNCRCYIKGI